MSSDIMLSPFYHSSVSEITRPNSLVFVSHYFVDRWMPDLGPTATAILICLRSHCYQNRQTNELRDTVQLSLPQIAKECGVSYKTVQREMMTNMVLKKFVRIHLEYAHGKTPASLRRDANSYQVSMDDPIHPDDDQELIEIVRRKAEAQDKGSAEKGTVEEAKARARQKPIGQIVLSAKGEDKLSSPPGQIVPYPPDKLSSPPGQIVPALIESFSFPIQNSYESAASAAPDFSLSLSPEKTEEKIETEQIVPFAQLTESEQAPWLEQAETELRENFGLAAWLKTAEKARAGIRAQRAGNLYLEGKKR